VPLTPVIIFYILFGIDFFRVQYSLLKLQKRLQKFTTKQVTWDDMVYLSIIVFSVDEEDNFEEPHLWLCLCFDFWLQKNPRQWRGFFTFAKMRKKQNYLTKKFKGHYIERLQEFLCELDADWNWNMSMYLNAEYPPTTAFAKLFCKQTGNLVLVRMSPIEKRIDKNEAYFRFVIEKIGERVIENREEPSYQEIPKLFEDEKLLWKKEGRERNFQTY